MERRLIDANAGVELLQRMAANYAAIGRLKEAQDYAATANVLNSSACFPTIDAEPVRHGRWVHEIHDFYRESMCEDYCLTVFITTKCSECGEKHGENGQVYSQDFIGEEGGERPVENVAEKIDLARRNYLAGLRRGRYKLKNYCPNCGAKMDAKEDDRE